LFRQLALDHSLLSASCVMRHAPWSFSVRIGHSCVCIVARHGLEVPVMAGIVGNVELVHSLHVLFNSGVVVCI
jgi:hypothetical protein